MQSSAPRTSGGQDRVPDWVPLGIRAYLDHVEGGQSYRHVARQHGVHASTVMRQVQRTECLRDDPLADAALRSLETLWRGQGRPGGSRRDGGIARMDRTPRDQEKLDRDTLRALRALTEPGAMLVIADGIEEAVIVKSGPDDRPVRRAVVSRDVAEILALKEWIEGRTKGKLARYTITPAGRTELGRLVARSESRQVALNEGGVDGPCGVRPRMRSAGAEAPLRVLARRKRSDGAAFLTPEMVRAAERFRESHEIARAGGVLGDDAQALLAGRVHVPAPDPDGTGAVRPRQHAALDSLLNALRTLGPDLGEVAILACCNETGMEDIESRLEFPARSGKIVLRIALATLVRHYARVGDEGQDMIY
jgi:transposase-like protein